MSIFVRIENFLSPKLKRTREFLKDRSFPISRNEDVMYTWIDTLNKCTLYTFNAVLYVDLIVVGKQRSMFVDSATPSTAKNSDIECNENTPIYNPSKE